MHGQNHIKKVKNPCSTSIFLQSTEDIPAASCEPSDTQQPESQNNANAVR